MHKQKDGSVANELLKPSLRSNSDVRYGLSIKSQFLVGFFGGPFMALPYLTIHSYYQGKTKQDISILILIVALLSAASYGVYLSGFAAENQWINKILSRGGGVCAVGIYYLFNRENQKNIENFERYKNPWKPVLISAFIGFTLMILMTSAIMGRL